MCSSLRRDHPGIQWVYICSQCGLFCNDGKGLFSRCANKHHGLQWVNKYTFNHIDVIPLKVYGFLGINLHRIRLPGSQIHCQNRFYTYVSIENTHTCLTRRASIVQTGRVFKKTLQRCNHFYCLPDVHSFCSLTVNFCSQFYFFTSWLAGCAPTAAVSSP